MPSMRSGYERTSATRSGVAVSAKPIGQRSAIPEAGLGDRRAKALLGEPGQVSVHSRCSKRHVPRTSVDNAPVRGLRNRRRIQ